MRSVSSEDFNNQRSCARLSGRYDEAEDYASKMSNVQTLRLLWGPIVVGEVTCVQPDGSKTASPLYLLMHDNHMTLDHPHGFKDENERLDCHCGHRHYFPRLAGRVRELALSFRFALPLR